MKKIKVINDITFYKNDFNDYVIAFIPMYYFFEEFLNLEKTYIGLLVIKYLKKICDAEKCKYIVICVLENKKIDRNKFKKINSYILQISFKSEKYLLIFLQCPKCKKFATYGNLYNEIEEIIFDYDGKPILCTRCL